MLLLMSFACCMDLFPVSPESNLGFILPDTLIEVNHYTAKAYDTTTFVGFGCFITAIMATCKVDLFKEKHMEKENRLNLSCLQCMHSLGGCIGDTNQFGYLFTPFGQGIHMFLLPSG